MSLQKSSLTIHELVNKRIKEKGFSLSQFVSAIGYSNISKGCRRLDIFLKNLYAPSEDFIIKIISILEIDSLTFYRAVKKTFDQFNAVEKSKFTPFVTLITSINIRPHMYMNFLTFNIPLEFQNNSLADEIEMVKRRCKEHIDSRVYKEWRDNIIGFKYHREYDYYFKFDLDFTLKETVIVQYRTSERVFLDKNIVEMLQITI